MVYIFGMIQEVTQSSFERVFSSILKWFKTEGLKILFGLIALFLLFKVINLFTRNLQKIFEKKHVDKTVEVVTLSIVRKGLKIILVVIFFNYLGIQSSSITALVASIGVGLGLAFQGSLSNLAGGIIILLMRPFKIDDFIETNDQIGTVEDIRVFYTLLTTPDNKVVLIPNGTVANSVIINYSKKRTRRLDLVFSISYKEDLNRAKEVILEAINIQGKILKSPQPFINIKNHGLNSVELLTRVWCNSNDYWDINFQLLELVKKGFDENNISIPYQQIDIHLKKDE